MAQNNFPHTPHRPKLGALEVLKYIGPGLLVTVGFVDPGNWASNLAAGSGFGYPLLWVVTLSTIMLTLLQHNAAHLGIATGLCLSEAATKHLSRPLSRGFLGTAMIAAVATALAELLGAAIGLNMLFGLPLPVGALLTAATTTAVLFTNSYRRIERYIIALVSLVGLSFLFELSIIDVDWPAALRGWVVPSFPTGSLPLIMAVLGAVVMPHNLFLHSEVIQSRQWNLQDDQTIRRQLKFEFLDTLLAMGVGWAINSAMLIVAASVFFAAHVPVTELQQAEQTLRPLLGHAAATVFAIALLLSGFSSSVTAGMAGASIWAGMFGEPMDLKDSHSRLGVVIAIVGAVLLTFVVPNPFQALVWSQISLSMQLPLTVVMLIALTSATRVMGRFKNDLSDRLFLWATAGVVVTLNILLLISLFR